jgi:hypothetical protein
MKKIKATEVVLFVCLLVSCLIVPRFVTSQLLSGVTHQVYNYDVHWMENVPVFPEGGWFEQAIRIGLIGLTVLFALRVARRLDGRPPWRWETTRPRWVTTIKKIKVVEVVVFTCLLVVMVFVPPAIHLEIMPVRVGHALTANEIQKNAEWEKAWGKARYPGPEIPIEAAFGPPYKDTVHMKYVDLGSWPEWVVRIGLIGLTVWYAFRVAKRINRESLPGGKDRDQAEAEKSEGEKTDE